MFHFSREGFIENGEIRFQVKATDHLRVVDRGKSVGIEIEIRDIKFWSLEPNPFILVLYDARNGLAFWLHIQEYVKQIEVDDCHETVTLRIPFAQKLTLRSIDHFRCLSLDNIKALCRERNPDHDKAS